MLRLMLNDTDHSPSRHLSTDCTLSQEGRLIWEQILSISRNLSRLASLYSDELGNDRRKRVFRLLAAFPFLLRHHIQPECLGDCDMIHASPCTMLLTEPASSHLRGTTASTSSSSTTTTRQYQSSTTQSNPCWIDRRSMPWCLLPDGALLHNCANAANRPLWICDRLSHELSSVAYTPHFSSQERLAFLEQVDKLSQCIGECERIHQTAVPLNYARHSLRSLTLWLATVPFCLISQFGLVTGPVVGAVAWLLLGVYQIGFTIEDPFQESSTSSSLRLSLLCNAVYRNVRWYDDNAAAASMSSQKDETSASSDGNSNSRRRDDPEECGRDSAYRLEEEEEWDGVTRSIVATPPFLVARLAP